MFPRHHHLILVFAILVAFPCGTIFGQTGENQPRTVRFWGEVAQGLEFRKDISRGLDFVLLPENSGAGITGWTIRIEPHERPSNSECSDFLWVVTPPFRFRNIRDLSTAYGTPAQEAVAMSPRDFNFVLNCEDYQTEYERVEKALWPANHTKEDVDEAIAKIGTIRHGTGHVWIRDSKYTPGDKTTDPVKLGEIHWIKFEVEIKFPEEPPTPAKP